MYTISRYVKSNLNTIGLLPEVRFDFSVFLDLIKTFLGKY